MADKLLALYSYMKYSDMCVIQSDYYHNLKNGFGAGFVLSVSLHSLNTLYESILSVSPLALDATYTLYSEI